MTRIPLISMGVLIASLAGAAKAEVLTEGAQSRLCSRGRVEPGALALALVSDSRAAVFASSSLSATPGALTTAEAIYAVSHLGDTGSDEQPFGAGYAGDPEALEAAARIRDGLREFFDLIDKGYKNAGARRYRLEPRNGRPAPRSGATVLQLFQPDGSVVILCENNPDAPPIPATTGQIPDPIPGHKDADWGSRWRIRGAASDLSNPANSDDLSPLKPATFGFLRDDVAGTETTDFNLVAGARFGPQAGKWDAIPYLSYRRKNAAGAGDIDTFAPGLLVTYRHRTEQLALLSKLELSYVIDGEQSSEQVKARLYLQPSFELPDKQMLFGQRLYFMTDKGHYLEVLPELTVIGDLSDIRDRGSNPAFQNGGSYRGLGGSLGVRLALGGFDRPNLEGWSLSAGRRQMWFSGDIAVDDPSRWHATLEYSWKTAPFGIALTYSEGENDDTFQAEDTLELKLTWRH